MAHKLQGHWRSFTIDRQTGMGRTDGEMFIRIREADGVVLQGSGHDGKGLTGHARVATGVHTIELDQDEATNLRKHTGILVIEQDVNGGKSLVVLGHYVDTPKFAELEADEKGREPLVQNQGEWILTKP